MARRQVVHNHLKFYKERENRTTISRHSVSTGQIVTFKYPSATSDKEPLLFVLDTDMRNRKIENNSISGINLNYMTVTHINRFFVKVLQKAPWKKDESTKFSRVDLHDEGASGGVTPAVIYEGVVKKNVLNRVNCWRKYKFNKMSGNVQHVNFKFNVSPLKELMGEDNRSIGKISEKETKEITKKIDENKL